MKLHFFGKKSMSLKRFYRYVLITILLVILCFVLTAVCLTFISQKNKILTHCKYSCRMRKPEREG